MSSEFSPDLDAYFARIGYDGPCAATRDLLAEITRRHVYAIPFESLDIQLGRPIHLEPARIEAKLVREKRGGYCFEQNTYLAHVLRTLGFEVRTYTARVRWQVPPDVITARAHMVLIASAGGKRYLADVGFGSLSLTAPLDLDLEGEQPTPHEARRIIRRGDNLHVQQARIGAEWLDVYEFTLEEQLPINFEVVNWWTSTHPQSRFVQNLVVARSADGVRYTIFNDDFTARHTDGRAEKRTLRSPDELLAVLAEYFGLSFPPGTRFGKPGARWPN